MATEKVLKTVAVSKSDIARVEDTCRTRCCVIRTISKNLIKNNSCLLSPPVMPNLRAEFGAMHYTSTQMLVCSLVENKLRLKTYNFPSNKPENIVYLRGYHRREADLSNPEKVPYNLHWHEKGKSASLLVVEATLANLTTKQSTWAVLTST